MPSYRVPFAACAIGLAASTLASPISNPNKHRHQVHQSVPLRSDSGLVHYANVHRKYRVDVPGDVVAALAQSNVIATPGAYDSRYLCPVNIGGQTLNLDFDTGSADLWVFSTELSPAETAGHTLYNPSTSSTAQVMDGYTWSIEYADGSFASGNVYTDTVTIDNVTVSAQAVELAEQVSTQFQEDQALDGLLGLSFSNINSVQPRSQLTFFDNAIQTGAIQEPIFTADLRSGEPGTYEFGYIDSSKHTGTITYAPVDSSNGFWNITGTGYGIGNSVSELQAATFHGIVDTGTTLLVLDDEIVSSYWGSINGAIYDAGQGGYTFPCAQALSDLSIGIAGYTAVVPGAYLNFAPIDSTTCYGGLQSDSAIGFSILGDVFIKSQFVVFDAGNLQVGFAPKNLNLNTGAANSTQVSADSSSSSVAQTVAVASSGFSQSLVPTSVPSSTPYDNGMWHTTYYHEVTSASSATFSAEMPIKVTDSILVTTSLPATASAMVTIATQVTTLSALSSANSKPLHSDIATQAEPTIDSAVASSVEPTTAAVTQVTVTVSLTSTGAAALTTSAVSEIIVSTSVASPITSGFTQAATSSIAGVVSISGASQVVASTSALSLATSAASQVDASTSALSLATSADSQVDTSIASEVFTSSIVSQVGIPTTSASLSTGAATQINPVASSTNAATQIASNISTTVAGAQFATTSTQTLSLTNAATQAASTVTSALTADVSSAVASTALVSAGVTTFVTMATTTLTAATKNANANASITDLPTAATSISTTFITLTAALVNGTVVPVQAEATSLALSSPSSQGSSSIFTGYDSSSTTSYASFVAPAATASPTSVEAFGSFTFTGYAYSTSSTLSYTPFPTKAKRDVVFTAAANQGPALSGFNVTPTTFATRTRAADTLAPSQLAYATMPGYANSTGSGAVVRTSFRRRRLSH